MKRRSFIKSTSATAVSMPFLLNGLNIGVLPRSSFFKLLNPDNDKVLVIIQLQGGNDGLNMVLPLDKYENLANARANILIPENEALQLVPETGLHPAMTGLKSLFDDAKLTIVHSAGYPDQNRSHFRSTDIWTSGSASDEFVNPGWLGRYFLTKYPGYPTGYPNVEVPDPVAITMSSLTSETCQGTISNYSLAITDPFALSALNTGQDGQLPDTPYGYELEFLRGAIAQTNAYTDVILGAAKHGANRVTYPAGNTNPLANQLRNVALLISGGLQTKVYVCNLGGFDTHAAQVVAGSPTTGTHATLMSRLSEAISLFQEDLKQLGLEERVVGMTFSEFGRQIASNFSDGTDHGTAAPLLVFGSCVYPGFVGENPEIAATLTNQEGVAMQNDFRDVYGSILMDWFDVEESEIRELLYEDFQHLPIVKPCSSSKTDDLKSSEISVEMDIFPNPFVENTLVRFKSEKEYVKLSLYDVRGQELEVLCNKTLDAGEHKIELNGSRLATGNYYLRLQLSGRQKTKMVARI
ncbi:MAG TPA: DUF1501 domain-containing protein [Saprospiraceae bacterium]|nr:DUF1501 domain-containing protein [Saprospiraceae bacterium]